MRKIPIILICICLLLLACAPHPASIKKTKVKKKSDKEVVIILSDFLGQYNYDSLGTVQVELKRRMTEQDMTLSQLLFGIPIPGSDNPWLTTTEEMLVKLIKKAEKLGANAVTNLELGSYEWYSHEHTEDAYDYKYAVYAKATAIIIHNLNLTE